MGRIKDLRDDGFYHENEYYCLTFNDFRKHFDNEIMVKEIDKNDEGYKELSFKSKDWDKIGSHDIVMFAYYCIPSEKNTAYFTIPEKFLNNLKEEQSVKEIIENPNLRFFSIYYYGINEKNVMKSGVKVLIDDKHRWNI